jgi:hypothetical protein
MRCFFYLEGRIIIMLSKEPEQSNGMILAGRNVVVFSRGGGINRRMTGGGGYIPSFCHPSKHTAPALMLG